MGWLGSSYSGPFCWVSLFAFRSKKPVSKVPPHAACSGACTACLSRKSFYLSVPLNNNRNRAVILTYKICLSFDVNVQTSWIFVLQFGYRAQLSIRWIIVQRLLLIPFLFLDLIRYWLIIPRHFHVKVTIYLTTVPVWWLELSCLLLSVKHIILMCTEAYVGEKC